MEITTGTILTFGAPLLGMVFKQEVVRLLLDFLVWKRRAFNGGDTLEILNKNTGVWHTITITDFTFGFSAADRTVGILYPETGKKSRISFAEWATIPKRK